MSRLPSSGGTSGGTAVRDSGVVSPLSQGTSPVACFPPPSAGVGNLSDVGHFAFALSMHDLLQRMAALS